MNAFKIQIMRWAQVPYITGIVNADNVFTAYMQHYYYARIQGSSLITKPC